MTTIPLTTSALDEFFQNNEKIKSASSTKKDLLDHLQDCASNRDDLNDYFLDPFAHLLDWLTHLRLDDKAREEVKRIHSGVDLVASVLSIPCILDHINKFKRHVYALKEAWGKHPNVQNQSTSRLFKKATHDLLKIANNTSETAIFLHHVEIIDLKKSFPMVEGFYHATSLVSDGWDILHQVEKLNKYQSLMDDSSSKYKKGYFEKKKSISYLNILRDVISIALSVIGILSLVYAAMMQSLLFVPPLALTLSTTYLVLSIWTYISKKSLEDQKKLLIKI